MLYLNTEHINTIGVEWEQLTNVISEAARAIGREDYSQPIKPYLRYGDPKNRIIAMPAYIGGNDPLAGIKWIASFPDNIYQKKLRAHSVTILNESGTGIPFCIINTAAVSAIRTASVSGLMVKEYLQLKKDGQLKVGITGFGPIGRMHLRMIASLLGERLDSIRLYDLNGIEPESIDASIRDKVQVCDTWQECYMTVDIFITCTVSAQPYVDIAPSKGSLQLNVSLRDYKPEMRKYMDLIVVDNWEEVCRQNTDIENMHKREGLEKADTVSIAEVVCNDALSAAQKEHVIMFNPMGMAVFDLAVGSYYYQQARRKNIGTALPD